ncbi:MULTISPECIES: YggS family pyridoxal phosphate-dependent enzyme [Halomonas]|uniref:YggS family pyridoxal phosphate-dependent enzyme n=1 Tax=Halomonas TaxID=2745 RepID=UPI001C9433A9|nr:MULTISPECIES: YggS family pyridoxal phosphate-dependent enzyme [Halomonas]MBY6205973.1 YggS family pyridoxal phosphate-dependent enzyme [Halomonas sp. DP3Y7-2]MBY6228136.1 YggS family pyridoxal phosphate-dependent enzyme [Halomonas sp. DP3Y7-1]MCA0916202.1 YggS family pyridoxal phosphate-dependent enzyme [Halomonas denitrificans]
MTTTITESLISAQTRMLRALEAAQRGPDDALLLAVSKTKPASMIREAYEQGQRDFGENYLQEALEKQKALADCDAICWHFIGPLQSNKTRDVAEHFAWVHSVDRVKIARRLSEQRPAHLPPLNICLQVNVSNEPSKSGVGLEDLPELAAQVAALPGLQLRGLMTIPAPCDDTKAQRQPFRQLASALARLREQLPQAPLDTLSMGMSADLEAAIAEGATMVRLGTAIFGSRQ